MSDFISRGVVGGGESEQKYFDVVSGTTSSIVPGDIVVIANGYAAKVANGGAAAGNLLLGLALSTSTETAGANGEVLVEYHPSGLVVRGKATTPANLAAAVLYDKVTVDVDGNGVQTIDENDAGAILIYDFVGDDFTTTGLIDVVLPFTLAS